MGVETFYSEKMWTLRFWEWGSRYTIAPNRHIGLDIGTGRRAIDVPALLAGRVVRVRHTDAMGMCVVVQTGDRFLAYCHLSKDRLPKLGAEIAQGERVGRLAAGPASLPWGHLEFPGKSWDGIHLHLVVTNVADAAYTAPRIKGALFYDPADTIRAVLKERAGKPAGVPAGTPINIPTASPLEEEAMTHIISVNKNQYAVGQEFISHLGDANQATVTRNVTSIVDELHTLSVAQFNGLLDGLGIPRGVLDNSGRVLNPESGKHEANGVWSRRREAVAKLDRLLKR